MAYPEVSSLLQITEFDVLQKMPYPYPLGGSEQVFSRVLRLDATHATWAAPEDNESKLIQLEIEFLRFGQVYLKSSSSVLPWFVWKQLRSVILHS